MDNRENHRYITGLDGLRAFAIFFIVAYHLSFSWACGGFLGVDIFFVLSGYLITYKLLPLLESEPGLDLLKFWRGRIRRLLPAVYVMVITAVIWVILFNKELLTKLWGDAASSVFYATNWWFIFHKVSYFDSFGTPSPLKHLWFLGVQEQFFFVWSIVLAIGLRYLKKREKLSIIVFIWALCSSLLMGIMYNPEADPSRIYYGTDTRSFELLIGSLLAIVLPMEKLSSEDIPIMRKNILNIAGIVTLAVFILSAIFMDEYQDFLYRGGIFLLNLNTALLVICICQPSCFISGILSLKPLRWIGTRSFGIYLWHYPIIVLSTPVYEIGNPAYWRVGLQITAACIIAELSYRFIEMPVRKLGLRGFYRKLLSFFIFKWGKLASVKKIPVIIAASMIVVLAIGITGILKNEKKIEKTESYPAGITASSIEQAVSIKDSKMSPTGKSALNPYEKDEVSTFEKSAANLYKVDEATPPEKSTVNLDKKNTVNSPSVNKIYSEILAIGDSVMLDILPNLKKEYANITVDGKVSRQMSEAVKLAPAYAEFNSADKGIIIQLGTNGYFTEKQIDSLLNTFSKADVYLVNTRVPRPWEKKVNEVLKEKAEERENVTLVDWYYTAIKHPEYFGRDGVHLKPSGCEALTYLIREALNSKRTSIITHQ